MQSTFSLLISMAGMYMATSLAALYQSPLEYFRSLSQMSWNNLVQKALRWLMMNPDFRQKFFVFVLQLQGRENPMEPREVIKLVQMTQRYFSWKKALKDLKTCLPISSSSPSTVKYISQGLQNLWAAQCRLGIAMICFSLRLIVSFSFEMKWVLAYSSIFLPVLSVDPSSIKRMRQLEQSCCRMERIFLRYLSWATLLQLGTTTQKGNYLY